jgi:hypothetical protein
MTDLMGDWENGAMPSAATAAQYAFATIREKFSGEKLVCIPTNSAPG